MANSTPVPSEPKYTVFIKVPFPRGSFIDPPHTNWSSTKEAELWTLLNAAPKGSGIDWDSLAQHFSTSSSFLLQQAAWLYERQLSHVREHLNVRHGRQNSVTAQAQAHSQPQTPPGSAAGGSQAMRRVGSGGQGSRAPSSLSIRPRISSELRREESATTPPGQRRVPYSRTTSATTITQLQRSPPAHNSPRQKGRTFSTEQAPTSPLAGISGKPLSDSDSDDSSSSDTESAVAQSRVYARRPRFPATTKGKSTLNILASPDEDSDETPDFLPFSALNQHTNDASKGRGKTSQTEGLASTLRTFKSQTVAGNTGIFPAKRQGSGSSSGTLSSPNQASSNQSFSSPRGPRSSNENSRVLSALSPRHRKIAKDESEGTPSMGSSFSDLDDASISRSAMEEAMAREIKAGKGSLGVASRISGMIRHASNAGAGGSSDRRS